MSAPLALTNLSNSSELRVLTRRRRAGLEGVTTTAGAGGRPENAQRPRPPAPLLRKAREDRRQPPSAETAHCSFSAFVLVGQGARFWSLAGCGACDTGLPASIPYAGARPPGAWVPRARALSPASLRLARV